MRCHLRNLFLLHWYIFDHVYRSVYLLSLQHLFLCRPSSAHLSADYLLHFIFIYSPSHCLCSSLSVLLHYLAGSRSTCVSSYKNCSLYFVFFFFNYYFESYFGTLANRTSDNYNRYYRVAFYLSKITVCRKRKANKKTVILPNASRVTLDLSVATSITHFLACLPDLTLLFRVTEHAGMAQGMWEMLGNLGILFRRVKNAARNIHVRWGMMRRRR